MGLFAADEVRATKPQRRAPGCGGCGLWKECNIPKMDATGDGEKGILILGEAQGEEEDKLGQQFVGKAGRYLRRALKDCGIDLNRDCRKINAICCRPPDNRKPTDKEIMYCHPKVWAEIERFKPKLIMPMGGTAIRSLFLYHLTESPGPISKWRGWKIPDRDLNCWIAPTFHPSYVQRSISPKNKHPEVVVKTIFEQDLAAAISLLNELPPPNINERSQIEVIREPSKIRKALRGFRPDFFSFDYETTGLKPYNKGHAIFSCAVSDGKRTFAFPLVTGAMASLAKLLSNPKTRKAAHNMKFEDVWTKVRLGCSVENWAWDSMLAAHVLDNRPDITGLKFQAYVRFGIRDYASHIQPYLEAPKKDGANGFNRIRQAPLNELLIYNGMDALLEHKLAMLQMEELGTWPWDS